jgi:hypothetical protein
VKSRKARLSLRAAARRLAGWLRRLGPRRQKPSLVWVFNNMPAGARVDTKVSCP